MYRGSDASAVIQEAREMNDSYENFASKMESIKQWNKGTSMENILRKIYAKYIYKGSQDTDEIEML